MGTPWVIRAPHSVCVCLQFNNSLIIVCCDSTNKKAVCEHYRRGNVSLVHQMFVWFPWIFAFLSRFGRAARSVVCWPRIECVSPGSCEYLEDCRGHIIVSCVGTCRGLNFPQTLSDFSTIRARKKKKSTPNLNTSVSFPSRLFLQRMDRLCAAAMQHPSVTTSAISSQRWNDMEIIGTKRLPACHGMQSVLYIHMYWTQTCHRLWQPHSSHTKPILSAAQCAPSAPPPSPILSDTIEMNMRTPWVCIQIICFSASHWSQFSEANKPGNYFITEMGWAPWVGATDGGESVRCWEIWNSFLRQSVFTGRAGEDLLAPSASGPTRSSLIWHPLDLELCWDGIHIARGASKSSARRCFMFSFICVHVQKLLVMNKYMFTSVWIFVRCHWRLKRLLHTPANYPPPSCLW